MGVLVTAQGDQINTLGSRIRAARRAKEMSMARLAAAVGVEKGAIWEIESGRTQSMRMENLRRVAEVLETSVEYLLAGVDTSGEERKVDIRTWARSSGGMEDPEIIRFLEESYRMLLEIERTKKRRQGTTDS